MGLRGREQLRGQPRDRRKRRHEIGGPDPGREQRLVRVTERGLGDRKRGLRTQRRRKALRAELTEPLSRPRGWSDMQIERRKLLNRAHEPGTGAMGLVDRHLSQPGGNLRATVFRLVSVQQVRALLDERGRHVPGNEIGVVEHGLQERNVRRDPTQAELGETAASTSDRRRVVTPSRDHLHEHRVEVR